MWTFLLVLRLKLETRLSVVSKINSAIVFCVELFIFEHMVKCTAKVSFYNTIQFEIFFAIIRKIGRKPSTNSSLSVSSSPSTATKQPKSLMTIIKGGHKSSVFSTSSPGTKSKSMKNEEGYELTKEEYEQLHASLPWFK